MKKNNTGKSPFLDNEDVKTGNMQHHVERMFLHTLGVRKMQHDHEDFAIAYYFITDGVLHCNLSRDQYWGLLQGYKEHERYEVQTELFGMDDIEAKEKAKFPHAKITSLLFNHIFIKPEYLDDIKELHITKEEI